MASNESLAIELYAWGIAIAGSALLVLVGAAPAVIPVLTLFALSATVLRGADDRRRVSRFAPAAATAVMGSALALPNLSVPVATATALILAAVAARWAGGLTAARLALLENRAADAQRQHEALELDARAALVRMQDLRETTAEVYWETDAQLRLCYLSDSFQGATGLAAHALLGLDVFDVAERYLGRYGRVAVCGARMQQQRVLRGMRLVWCDHSRRRRYARVNAVPRYGSFGRFAGYRGVFVAIPGR